MPSKETKSRKNSHTPPEGVTSSRFKISDHQDQLTLLRLLHVLDVCLLVVLVLCQQHSSLLYHNNSSPKQYKIDSPTLFSILGGWVYVNIGVSDISNPGEMSCSPYRPFAVVLRNVFL